MSKPRIREKTIFSTLKRNRQGFALPLVLGICMVISLITMAIVFSVRQRVVITQELKDRTSAFLAAHSAYNQAIYTILSGVFTSYGLKAPGEEGKEGVWWNLYGAPITLEEGVSVRLRDLSGMASPLAKPVLFSRLVNYSSDDPGAVNRFMDTLADWQDRDDLKRLNGAEYYDYNLAGLPQKPRNDYIQVPEELNLLMGFDRKVLEGVQDDLFFWGFGDINYLTMSKNMLLALFADETLVNQIVALRETGELTAARFTGLTGVVWGEGVSPFPSSCMRVEVTATINKSVEKITAVILRRENEMDPFRVIEWRK